MITAEELKKNYAKLSTRELLDIVYHPSGYTELAVSVAKGELSTRQVPEAELKAYEEEQMALTEVAVRRYIVEELSLAEKNLFYFVWLPLITIPLKVSYAQEGYTLRLKQANYYSFWGFVCSMAALILLVGLHTPALVCLATWIVGFIPAYALDERFNRWQHIKNLEELTRAEEEKEEGAR